jgi:hypothetical protein
LKTEEFKSFSIGSTILLLDTIFAIHKESIVL